MIPTTRTKRTSSSPSSFGPLTRNGLTTAAIMTEEAEIGAETARRVVPKMA